MSKSVGWLSKQIPVCQLCGMLHTRAAPGFHALALPKTKSKSCRAGLAIIALARQDFIYLAHHEPQSVFIILTIWQLIKRVHWFFLSLGKNVALGDYYCCSALERQTSPALNLQLLVCCCSWRASCCDQTPSGGCICMTDQLCLSCCVLPWPSAHWAMT